MAKEEGVVKMWNGVLSNMLRSATITCGQLATFDQIKETLVDKMQMQPGALKTRIIASICASLVACLGGCPFDNMKVRMQKMKKDKKTGKYPYKNLGDCFQKTIRREGVTKLWVGFPNFYVRVGSHIIIHLVMLDTVTRRYNSYVDDDF